MGEMSIFNWLTILWSWADLILSYTWKFSALAGGIGVLVFYIYAKYFRKGGGK